MSDKDTKTMHVAMRIHEDVDLMHVMQTIADGIVNLVSDLPELYIINEDVKLSVSDSAVDVNDVVLITLTRCSPRQLAEITGATLKMMPREQKEEGTT